MTITCPTCLTDNPEHQQQCLACGSQLQAQVNIGIHLPPGTILKNEYEIIESLGEGGFGITYKAKSSKIPYLVAIKELLPERAARHGKILIWSHRITPQERCKLISRYQQEALYLQRCKHTCIVEVYDWFQENDTAYMVMKFVAGQTLAQVIKRKTYIPESEIKNYAIKISQALEIAHQQKLLHRDIKPDNIIITDQGNPVLIDFGSAREFTPDVEKDLTQYVTPGYAPPEQYSKISKWGPYTDFYALCATLYEALTGIVPPDSISRLQQDTLKPPRQIRPNISHLMEQILMEGLKIKADQRFQSSTEFLDELQGRPRLLRRARASVQSGKLEEAISIYEQCLLNNPELEVVAIELAMVSIHLNNDPKICLSHAQQAVRLAPNDGRVFGTLGLAQCRLHQWDEGINNLSQGIRLSPRELWIRLNLVWALIQGKKLTSADNLLDPILKRFPKDSKILALQTYLSAQKNDWRSVISYGRQTILYTSQSSQLSDIASQIYPYLAFGLLNGTRNPRSQDFSVCLQEFSQKYPNDLIANSLYGWYLCKQLRFSEAIEKLTSIQKQSKMPNWALYALSLAQAKEGQLEPALSNLKIYLQNNLQDSESYIFAGILAAQLNQWQDGKNYLEKGIRLNARIPQAFHNLGWVILNIRRQKDTSELAKQMLDSYKQAYYLYSENRQTDHANRIKDMLMRSGIEL